MIDRQQIACGPHRRRVFEIIFQKCELAEDNELLGTRHRQNFLDGSDPMRQALKNAVIRQQLPADTDIEQAIVHLHAKLTGLIYLRLLLPDTFHFEKAPERAIDAYFYALLTCFRKS